MNAAEIKTIAEKWCAKARTHDGAFPFSFEDACAAAINEALAADSSGVTTLTPAEKKKFSFLFQGALNNFQLDKKHEGKQSGEYIKAGARELARLVQLEIKCH